MKAILKDKLTITLTAVKVLISTFITYLILFKGDAGTLVHNIGAFLIGGKLHNWLILNCYCYIVLCTCYVQFDDKLYRVTTSKAIFNNL